MDRSVFNIIIVCAVLFKVSTYDNVNANDCFESVVDKSDRCQPNRVKILSEYYMCDLAIELEASPKRIKQENGEIFVMVAGKTYTIQNDTPNLVPVKNVIIPKGELYDDKNNKYYVDGGSVYINILEYDNRNDVEIVTNGKPSVHQLTFNTQTKQVIILSFNGQNTFGCVYAISSDDLNVTNDLQIIAEIVPDIKADVTAIAVEKTSGNILIGIKTSKGGRVIRLKRRLTDPCEDYFSSRDKILTIMEESGERILRVFDESNISLLKRSVDFGEKSGREMYLENKMLESQLDRMKNKLELIKESIHSFRGISKGTERASSQPDLCKQDDVCDDAILWPADEDENDEEKICIPLKQFTNLKQRTDDFEEKFDKLSRIANSVLQNIEQTENEI